MYIIILIAFHWKLLNTSNFSSCSALSYSVGALLLGVETLWNQLLGVETLWSWGVWRLHYPGIGVVGNLDAARRGIGRRRLGVFLC